MILKKKLIEVALPLEAINKASAREKSIRHGHPSTLHLWWARRPLAAARAVIFAQMVDDPSGHPDLFPTEAAQETERQRLFKIIEDLVQWENTTNEEVLERAREEIRKSWRRTCAENADHPRAKELFDPDKLPGFHDPFAGGGALPLEAQRLGLEAYASDLNPVAVLINKAMIEIPPKFAGMPPVNPEARANKELFGKQWKGAEGLAEDVRYYGKWMRDEAEKRIGHLYPKVEITDEMAKERPDLKPLVGQKLTVIAWIWARTVKSPNPAFASVDVPLASTFWLSKVDRRPVYVQPVRQENGYQFTVHIGEPENVSAVERGTKAASSGNSFECIMSGAPIPFDYIRAEGKKSRIGARLMAIVVDGGVRRYYLPPSPEVEAAARVSAPDTCSEVESYLPARALSFRVQEYGMRQWRDLFTSRQLTGLSCLAALIAEAHARVVADVKAADLLKQSSASRVPEYANAVAMYLAFAVSKCADGSSTICRWMPQRDSLFSTFSKQALPMTWDFAEVNLLADCTRSLSESVAWTAESLEGIAPSDSTISGIASQSDAMTQCLSLARVVSTDPPYYDNIGYADLSDFFYVWLRKSLRPLIPESFLTLVAPKDEELVATPFRHASRERAEMFFVDGMTKAMRAIGERAHAAFPVTIYYAFKQSERDGDGGQASTGWETFLEAVMRAGLSVSGTLPIRTERAVRSVSMGTNALASSIVLVCRPRTGGVTITRREFVAALRSELPAAVARLQKSNIAPVDLAQAAIGPGMGIYTMYDHVVDASGASLSVRGALELINQTLDEVLAEQEGDFDSDSRWALAWFEQQGFGEGEYGLAETLSKAKNTSVDGLVDAGILLSRRGRVRLLTADELPQDWEPSLDRRLTAWEMVHHLIRVLGANGERAAAMLALALGGKAEIARELCYRLYAICERKKRATEALSYNALVQSWPEIVRLAREAPLDGTVDTVQSPQTKMFDDGAKPKKKRTKGKN